MNVALVYSFIPHYRAAVMRELLDRAEHHYILVADEQPIDPTIKAWRPEQEERFVPAPYRPLFAGLYYQKGLLELALRRDLQAIVYMAYPNFISTWLSACLARLAGKKVFFWTHGWTRKDRGLRAWLRTSFYKLAHGLLLYGHRAKQIGQEKGFDPSCMHVIYNSLDYSTQRRLRQSLDASRPREIRQSLFPGEDRPMVICAARLTKSCQFELLLAAQARLKSEGHLINVLLVGDGPVKEWLQDMALQLQVPVKFFGECYDEARLAELTMAAQLTVSPGKVGLTAMQSLAYGTPVVTHSDLDSQMPEHEAIVPGRTGEFFQKGDAADLARVIKKWTKDPPGMETREACYAVLDARYNPEFQRRAIDRAISGQPANDRLWSESPARAELPDAKLQEATT